MTPQEQFVSLYKQMADLCKENGWGDPFSYARSKEIYATCVLGHTMPGPNVYAGADGINENNEGVEYKSTTQETCRGSYTGISVQSTWEKQLHYLHTDKIGKYPEHYYNRFEDGVLVESWKMRGHKVLEILTKKLKKKYPTIHEKKDPRLSANISWTDIKKHGEQVI